MASIINASTSGVGGVITTADNTGNLNIQSGGSTKIAVTSAGVAVTGLSKASLPTGSVLQVVNATRSVETSNSTTTLADSGLTATIIPTSATSKILVIASIGGIGVGAAGGIHLALLQNSTTLYTFANRIGYMVTSSGDSIQAGSSINYLDSPATTSATTYKVQFKSQTGGAIVYTQYNNATSTITLMEIAA